jgi:hypothetical protein
MRGLVLTRTTVLAAAGGILVGLAGVGGVGYLLHARPVLHVASSAQECVNAPDHVASLFSDDENTLIRISNLDYSDLHVLRVEPAATLPGMFDALLALSSDSRRLAYVTASDELMNDARIQYLDVGSPDSVHALVQVPGGLAPVRPAWSPGGDQLAYVTGHPLSAFRPAGFEVWTVRADGSVPPQKVADLPLDVFAQGHSASLCFTAGGQIGLLQGVESAPGQPGPSPLGSPASAARTEAPSPSAGASPRNGSPCGVPVLSQNDPSWQSTIMQAGGDSIGGFGCALTSTAMLLNYYGAVLSPTDLNACMGAGADPIQWQSAPACTAGRVQGGLRTDFSWAALDAFLGAGKPVIVGMLRGLTGTHFVVVTQGGGGVADGYSITDPWDGSTTKTLGTYTNVGYNPQWIVSFDGPGRNCARLVPSSGAPVQGVNDGGTYQNGVTVSVPQGGSGSTTVQQVPTASPSPSPSPSASASATPSPTPTPTPTPTGTPTPTAKATPKATPVVGPIVWHLHPGGKITVSGEGIYQVFVCRASSRCRVLKFTIDRTPPVLALRPLNPHAGPIHTMAFHPMAAAPGIVVDRPGRLRLDALDTLSGVASVEYRLDGSGWTPYSDDVSFVRTLVVPTVGTHTISIRSLDLARNVGEVDDLTFQVIDTTPTPSPTPSATPTPTRRPPTATPAPTPAPTATPPSFQAAPTLTATLTSPPPPTCGPFAGPATWTVAGQITDTGGPGTATYRWVHDGVAQPTQSLTFNQAGTLSVAPDNVAVQLPPGAVTGMLTVQLQVISAPGGASSPVTLVCGQD